MTETTSFEQIKARVIAIGNAVQMQLLDEVALIQKAVSVGESLQSWPVALGEPDAQQFKSGVERFGTRWFLTDDNATRLTLQAGRSALTKLQREIQRKCNAEGFDVAFTSSGPRIRIPQPETQQCDAHAGVKVPELA